MKQTQEITLAENLTDAQELTKTGWQLFSTSLIEGEDVYGIIYIMVRDVEQAEPVAEIDKTIRVGEYVQVGGDSKIQKVTKISNGCYYLNDEPHPFTKDQLTWHDGIPF